MNLVEIVRYIAPSLTISVVFSTLILYFIQLFLGNRSKIINKYFLITFMCSFFALLTQFPLPIPDTLDCSGGKADPKTLRYLRSYRAVVELQPQRSQFRPFVVVWQQDHPGRHNELYSVRSNRRCPRRAHQLQMAICQSVDIRGTSERLRRTCTVNWSFWFVLLRLASIRGG
jgi:hypothetical protein